MSTVYPNQTTTGLASARSNESMVSAASWPAIFAGATAALAVSLLLAALGSGVGLSSISPWPNSGASPTGFTVLTAIWLVLMQWLSALLGGYLTGRLRTKWAGTHDHEVFFRDTAHGFVTWSLATVVTAFAFASLAGGVLGTGTHAAASAVSGVAQGAANALPAAAASPYDLDKLFRPAKGDGDASKSDDHAEVARILAQAVSAGGISAEDRSYVAQVVAARTGVSQEEAQQRVDQAVAAANAAKVHAQEAADAARKAAAMASLYIALSMLIGAFIAAAAAAVGGRLRDQHP